MTIYAWVIITLYVMAIGNASSKKDDGIAFGKVTFRFALIIPLAGRVLGWW